MAPPDNQSIDFGHGHWFRNLDESRRFLWSPDDLPRLFQLLGLRPGLQVTDFGCGWGYLGHLLLPAISPGGRVDGFDLHQSLLEKGRARATEASRKGRLRFTEADVTALEDVPDNRYDLAICQTVLMHLNHPEKAIAEMKRVVRPGGRVAAIEPDLFTARQSVVECDMDGELLQLRAEVDLHVMAGARASGAGDYRIGPRLPGLFAAAGLKEPQLWLNPRVHSCTPPYDLGDQHYADFLRRSLEPQRCDGELETWRALFDAGGGEPELWDELQRREGFVRQRQKDQLAERSHRRASTSALYVCVASVPNE
ncbi:MAG TPA: hypothetical protein DIU15_01430 [Deltaproteobacteria bacterium]|mgnify:CR=1 FL=1|nr:hypothetical protein [Deltaproteobacteria bacterium]HCP44686.1 hypothetical protein [Deltaproteobacteria bacterium]